MANQPQYVGVAKVGSAQISTANTNLDGTGTIETVFTAGTSGSRIDAINLKAVGTTTAGMVRLFIHDGTNARLFAELPVISLTPGASTPAFEAQLNTNTFTQVLPLILPTGFSLRASTHNAETFNVIAVGGDF